MSDQQLATTQPKASALALMASNFSVEPAKLLATLKATVFKGASDEELLALVVVANSYGLNPLCKEIYAFPAKGGGIVPVVPVDGWVRMMNDHPQFDGIDFEDKHDDKGDLVSVTAIISRKDRAKPIRITEYLSECVRNTEPWKMKHRMLRHKALTQCARVAFGFSGVHDEDEARDITPDVREIPKAQMGAVKTVDATLLPMEDKKPTEKTAPAAKKEKAAEKKPEPKPEPKPEATPAPEPDPAVDADKTPEAKLRDALTVAQFSEEDVVKMAVAMKLSPADTKPTIEALGAKNISMILEDWETAVETMREMRAK